LEHVEGVSALLVILTVRATCIRPNDSHNAHLQVGITKDRWSIKTGQSHYPMIKDYKDMLYLIQ
jgi:hypothetical protein